MDRVRLATAREQSTEATPSTDLKKNMRLIDDIPELKDRPEMRSLVEELNSENSFFRSVGCDAWDLENQPRAGEWVSRGYVQVAFEILDLNHRQRWDSLYTAPGLPPRVLYGREPAWPSHPREDSKEDL